MPSSIFPRAICAGGRRERDLAVLLLEPVGEPGDALLDEDLGFIPEQIARLGHIGVGDGNVAGLVGQVFDFGDFAQIAFDESDQIQQRGGVAIAEIDNLIADGSECRGANALDDVGDKSVIAFGRAIAELLDRAAFVDRFGKFMNRQIGSLARAVNGEKTQAGNVDAVEMMVDVAEGFTGEFGGRIRRDRIKNRVGFVEWNLGICPVNRGGRTKDEFFDALMPGDFK